MPLTRPFPRRSAVFSDRFVFTTLTEREVELASNIAYEHPETQRPCSLFTLDDRMAYQPFHQDYGPLNLAYTFEACVLIHERLEGKKWAQDKPVCLYTSAESTSKANMTLIVALYFIIVGHKEPQEAFHAIAKMEVMPFRDAGKTPVDHALYIQDCLYGIHKAMDVGLLDLATFDKESYRFYEKVENGDLNLLGPFIPFASPIEQSWCKAAKAAWKAQEAGIQFAWPPPQTRMESRAFRYVMKVFAEQSVGVVIRLNEELYDKRHFIDAGIEHVEMYFDDGTNPTDEIVRDFLDLAEYWIGERGMRMAVHCKAGLGRTGVLIGAYLIYKYQFSAQEAISYMRIVRPGMIVGPQQQYMMRNQMKWVAWAARDEIMREQRQLSKEQPREEQVNPLATPPAEPATPLPPSLEARRILTPPEHQIIDQVTAKLRNAISEPQHRPSSPVGLPPTSMDAVDQPRKAPARVSARKEEPVVDVPPRRVDIRVRSASPAAAVPAVASARPARPTRTIPAPPAARPESGSQTRAASRTERPATMRVSSSQTAATTTSSTSASTRGVKRTSTRLPIPDMSKPQARPAMTSSATRLNIPSQTIHRSSSNSSIASSTASDVGKPAKKRPAYGLTPSSPLGRAGISSPPASRESTPAEPTTRDIEIDMDRTITATTSPSSPTAPLRIPTKLRRKVTPTPMGAPMGMPSTPPPKGMPSSPPLSAGTTTTGSPKRSFIPSMRSVLPRDRQAGKPLPSLDEVVERSKRRTFTPPRMFGLGGSRVPQ